MKTYKESYEEEVGGETIWESGIIRLSQQSRDRFTVEYGLEIESGLDYAQAAFQLGACIMHDLKTNRTLQ